MSLESKLRGAIDGAKKRLPSFGNNVRKRLEKRLSDYLEGDNAEQNRQILEDELRYAELEYKDVLGGWMKRLGKAGGLLAAANDLYGYISKFPIDYIVGGRFLFLTLKTALELPGVYAYAKQTKDAYGVLKYALMKPLAMLVPFVGPAIEAGAFNRMVTSRIENVVYKRFMQKVKGAEYKSLEERLGQRTKTPVGKLRPTYEPLAA